MQFVFGSEVDWVDGLQGAGFSVNNPNVDRRLRLRLLVPGGRKRPRRPPRSAARPSGLGLRPPNLSPQRAKKQTAKCWLERSCADGRFTPPAELQRLTREWDAFLATGEAEGRLQLYLTGVGERSVEFSATANVAPGRHLLVFLDPERPGAPEAEAWRPVEAGSREPASLTDREVEILSLVAIGEQNADIAERFTVSPETVKSHVQNAMSKLGVHTRAHAVAVALVSGLIRWEDD